MLNQEQVKLLLKKHFQEEYLLLGETMIDNVIDHVSKGEEQKLFYSKVGSNIEIGDIAGMIIPIVRFIYDYYKDKSNNKSQKLKEENRELKEKIEALKSDIDKLRNQDE